MRYVPSLPANLIENSDVDMCPFAYTTVSVKTGSDADQLTSSA